MACSKRPSNVPAVEHYLLKGINFKIFPINSEYYETTRWSIFIIASVGFVICSKAGTVWNHTYHLVGIGCPSTLFLSTGLIFTSRILCYPLKLSKSFPAFLLSQVSGCISPNGHFSAVTAFLAFPWDVVISLWWDFRDFRCPVQYLILREEHLVLFNFVSW